MAPLSVFCFPFHLFFRNLPQLQQRKQEGPPAETRSWTIINRVGRIIKGGLRALSDRTTLFQLAAHSLLPFSVHTIAQSCRFQPGIICKHTHAVVCRQTNGVFKPFAAQRRISGGRVMQFRRRQPFRWQSLFFACHEQNRSQHV